MIRQDRVNTLRQTHNVMSTLMPLITAGLTITGAVIAAMETRNASAATPTEPDAQNGATSAGANAPTPHPTAHGKRGARGVSIRRYIATLAGRLLLVLLGIALVLAITLAATSTGRVGEAITLTALILLTLYLVEKVARTA